MHIEALHDDVRKRLCNQDGGRAMAATNIRDGATLLELVGDAVQLLQPVLHEVCAVAGTKEALDATEHPVIVRTPGNAFTTSKRLFESLEHLERADGRAKASRQERRTAFVGQHRRVLRRQQVGLRRGFVFDVARRALVREPLAHVAFFGPRTRCQLRRRHAATIGERLVETEPIAKMDQRSRNRCAEVAQKLAGKRSNAVEIDGRGHDGSRFCPHQAQGRCGGGQPVRTFRTGSRALADEVEDQYDVLRGRRNSSPMECRCRVQHACRTQSWCL